jgi:hypothetical protein
VPENSSKPIDFSDIGGKMIQGPMVAEKDAKSVDLSAVYGKAGKRVG